MPLWPGFCAPAYRARSQTIDAETCINLFFETISSDANAKHGVLLGTPALKFLQSAATNSTRGMFQQDGLIGFVIGAQFYIFDIVNTVLTAKGPIADDGLPVFFASNGRGGEQWGIAGGGSFYVYDLLTGALSAAIVLPFSNPVSLEFMNGYFLMNQRDSVNTWYSNLEDGEIWDALDFFARSQVSDNIVAIKRLRDKLWTFGSQTTEAFYNSEDPANPFIPYPGSIIQEGLITPYAMNSRGDSIDWLSQDTEGHGRMVTLSGDGATRLSTPAVEYALGQYQTIDDAEILVYDQEGHSYSCWIFPSGNTAWCYDGRENAWHERRGWNEDTGQWTVWRARGVCAPGNVIIVGDRFTGDIYTLDLNTYADACGVLKAERTWPYISAENQWMFMDQIELGIESGVGNEDAPDPQVMLELSRDSAHTYDPPMFAPMGKVGEYFERAVWFMCGRSRADRLVGRVTITAPVKRILGPGLWLRVTPGSGQR